MKLGIDDLRPIDDRKELDIGTFVNPELTKDKPVIVVIKKLTSMERDKSVARIIKHQEFDNRNRTVRYKDDDWYYESRVQTVLNGVDTDDERFPFKEWTLEFVKDISIKRSDLFEYLHSEIEGLSLPLLTGNDTKLI